MPETLTATTHVGVTRLAGHIGAEITGVGHRHAAERRGDRQDPPGPPGPQGGVPARPEPELPQAGRVRRAAGPADPGPPDAGLAARPAAPGGDRLAQGRQGQLLAHRRHLRRPAAGLHPAARRGDPAGGRRHDLGQHRLRVPEPAAGTARPGRPAAGPAHQRLRLRPHLQPRRAGRPGAGGGARGVRLHRLRDRAPAGAGAPGDQRTVARCSAASPAPCWDSPRRRRGT